MVGVYRDLPAVQWPRRHILRIVAGFPSLTYPPPVATLVIILALLTLPYAILAAVPSLRRDPSLRGRIGLCLVFLFTGSGHFLMPHALSQMIPPAVPLRLPIIYISGGVEIATALALLSPHLARPAGWLITLMLVGFLPFNIYAAMNRIPVGGHQWGPVYLLIRVPLQAVLAAWAYRFAIRRPRTGDD